jgi:DNA-directed RNA polymerase subunit M/transcription elongation factor TFIIS
VSRSPPAFSVAPNARARAHHLATLSLSPVWRRDQLEQIPDDIITDPTLQRAAISCPKCAHVGAVFFMAKVTASDERLKLIYVCTDPGCVHKWQD